MSDIDAINGLNTIPNHGSFGNAVSKINTNFDLVRTAIGEIKYNTEKCKGMYVSDEGLESAIPNPQPGDWAIVKGTTVWEIWVEDGGDWSNTNEEYQGGSIDLKNYATKAELEAFEDEINEDAVYAQDVVGEVTLDGFNVVMMTESAYQALETKDPNTLYFTTEG